MRQRCMSKPEDLMVLGIRALKGAVLFVSCLRISNAVERRYKIGYVRSRTADW